MFSFRLRFVLAPVDAIGITETVDQLPAGETRDVELRAKTSGVSIKDAKELVARSDGFKSQDEARAIGAEVKNALMLTLAGLRMGADFGDRDGGSGFYRAGLEMLERETGRRVLNDVHGLMIFGTEPAPSFASVGGATITRAIPSERFLDVFRRAFSLRWTPTARETLAFDLYNGSFFERSPRARLLTLIIAIEALIEPQPKTGHAAAHVEQLIAVTKSESALSDQERNSVIGSLRWLRSESISQAGRRLVENRVGDREYMQMPAARFFEHCYSLRSKMVHGGGIRGDEAVVRSTAASLEVLVADLLAAPYLGSID